MILVVGRQLWHGAVMREAGTKPETLLQQSSAALRARVSAAELAARFGLTVRHHRLGTLDLQYADLDHPDALVRELYADELEGRGDAPTWPVCWPAAFGLAEFVLQHRAVAGQRVLELGCGTAVPGVAAACSGADVLATDRDALALTVARHNAALNQVAQIRFIELDWFVPAAIGAFDLILGADVVYFAPTYRALLATAERHLNPGGQLLLSDPDRAQMAEFLPLAQNLGWHLGETRVVVHLWSASHPIRIRQLTPPSSG